MTSIASTAPPVFRSIEGEARFMAAYDAVLKEWPVEYQSLHVPTRLGTTHVIASGPPDAPVALLLPSMAATATLWQPNVAALSKYFRTYAIDVIGQVGKSIPTRRIRSRHELADWLAEGMDGLGVRRASLVGSSYGAFLAMNQALSMPERVERMVLIGPAATFVGFSWKFYYTMLVKGPILRLVRKRRRELATKLPDGMPLAANGWGRLMAVTMAESARPNLVTPRVFSRAELRAVRAPTLLLIGANERLYDAHAALRVAEERMPGLAGAVIADAPHLAAMAQPGVVNEWILRFLRGIVRGPQSPGG
jgi:pimeloyl-ACP methyl ester carboxylesterase